LLLGKNGRGVFLMDTLGWEGIGRLLPKKS